MQHRESLREYIEQLEKAHDGSPDDADERQFHFSLKGDARKREVTVETNARGIMTIVFSVEDEEWLDRQVFQRGNCWLYLYPASSGAHVGDDRYTVEAIAENSPVPSTGFLNALPHASTREKYRVAGLEASGEWTHGDKGELILTTQPLVAPFRAASPRPTDASESHPNASHNTSAGDKILDATSTSARGSEEPSASEPAPPGSTPAATSESLSDEDDGPVPDSLPATLHDEKNRPSLLKDASDLQLEAKIAKVGDRTRIVLRAKDHTDGALWLKMIYAEIGPGRGFSHLRLRGTGLDGDTMRMHPVDFDVPHDKRDLYLEKIQLVAGGEEGGFIYLTLEPHYSGRTWLTPPPKDEDAAANLKPIELTDDVLPQGEPAIRALMHALERGAIQVVVQREPTGLRVRFVDPATQTSTTEKLYEVSEPNAAPKALELAPSKFPPEHPAVQKIVGLVERRSRISADEVSAILEGRRG